MGTAKVAVSVCNQVQACVCAVSVPVSADKGRGELEWALTQHNVVLMHDMARVQCTPVHY